MTQLQGWILIAIVFVAFLMLGRDLDRIRKQLELLAGVVYDSNPERISRNRHKRQMEDVRFACELTKKQAAK